MDKEHLKKVLAGIGIASLLAGTTLGLGGCSSAWAGKKDGAGSATEEKKPAQSGWGAKKEGAGSTTEEKPPAKSGWGGAK